MSLYTIGVELTNACNLKCLHCMRDFSSPKHNFSLDLLDRICKEAKAFGVKEISFTGGEPLLYPRFAEAVDLVIRHGYTFSFITNSALFPRISSLFSRGTRKKALNRVCLSLDGATEKIHDFNRGAGSYRQVMEAIAQCHALCLPMALQMSVGTFNRHEIEAMALLSSQIKATDLYYAHIMPTRKNMEKGLLLSPEESLRAEDEVKRLQEAMNLPIFLSVGNHNPSPFYQCVALTMQRLNIDYLGRLTLCCQVSNYQGCKAKDGLPDVISDLHTTSLTDALHGLVKLIGEIQQSRLKKISRGRLALRDHFPCFSCALTLGKLGFLKSFPDNPWAKTAACTAKD